MAPAVYDAAPVRLFEIVLQARARAERR